MTDDNSADIRTALWGGLAMLAVLGFVLGVVPELLPDEEDGALRDAQALFNTIAMGEPLGVYNSLHPELQQRVSFARCQQVMEAYRGVFRKLKPQRAVAPPYAGTFDFDVESPFLVNGARRVMTVRQRGFNGMRRITDGEIESLTTTHNTALITDITLDGRSIF